MSMSWLLVLTLLPLVIFVVVDAKKDLKTGVWSAIGMAALTTAGFCWMIGEVEWEAVLIFILMSITGLLSIKKNEPIYFKLQPFITGMGTVLFLSYFQFFDEPFFIKYLPKMQHLLDSSAREALANPVVLETMVKVNLLMIVWSFVHAVIMGVAAFKWSNKVWITLKVLGLPFVLVMSFISLLFIRR